MLSKSDVQQQVGKARSEDYSKRNFQQAFELVMKLKDIDVKKLDLNINEVVFLPNKLAEEARICVFASGDTAVRARNAGADRVIESGELDTLASEKRSAKKLAREYQFFLADTSLMPKIGRILGQFLGPKGRMPTPVPPAAPIEALLARYRNGIRVKSRGSLSVAGKVGDESLNDSQVAENALAVINQVERKLPNGEKNIQTLLFKKTMGKPIKTKMVES
ncbi:MAG TPA: 50S ribosomal protein L1 [Nitrososphaerales archaeon]|nr:50S ribosomal protein L1 [Nitrososphaerales archaeon]